MWGFNVALDALQAFDRGWLYFRAWGFCVELDAAQSFGREIAPRAR